VKKTKYIMNICGQVSRQMARGEVLRSGVVMDVNRGRAAPRI
jgi:hypothetical protein